MSGRRGCRGRAGERCAGPVPGAGRGPATMEGVAGTSRLGKQSVRNMMLSLSVTVLLSGFVFPIENMPEAVQVLTYVNPMLYLFVILRGIFLKGVGTAVLWPQILALALFGGVTLALASLRFRKTLK